MYLREIVLHSLFFSFLKIVPAAGSPTTTMLRLHFNKPLHSGVWISKKKEILKTQFSFFSSILEVQKLPAQESFET